MLRDVPVGILFVGVVFIGPLLTVTPYDRILKAFEFIVSVQIFYRFTFHMRWGFVGALPTGKWLEEAAVEFFPFESVLNCLI